MSDMKPLSPAELTELERSHRLVRPGMQTCYCGDPWPCPVARLLRERERLRGALRAIDLSDHAALEGVADDEIVVCRRPAYIWRWARAALGEEAADAE